MTKYKHLQQFIRTFYFNCRILQNVYCIVSCNVVIKCVMCCPYSNS